MMFERQNRSGRRLLTIHDEAAAGDWLNVDNDRAAGSLQGLLNLDRRQQF